MSVCIYRGSFDPVHNGHVAIIKFLSSEYERVIILIGEPNPHKPLRSETQHRKNMLQLVTADYSNVIIDDVRTKEDIFSTYSKIAFVVGSDGIPYLKYAPSISEFVIIKRDLSPIPTTIFDIPTRIISINDDISSTQIRKYYFYHNSSLEVHPLVDQYISDNKLYETETLLHTDLCKEKEYLIRTDLGLDETKQTFFLMRDINKVAFVKVFITEDHQKSCANVVKILKENSFGNIFDHPRLILNRSHDLFSYIVTTIVKGTNVETLLIEHEPILRLMVIFNTFGCKFAQLHNDTYRKGLGSFIHKDPHPGNWMYVSDETYGVIDIDDASYGNAYRELMTIVQTIPIVCARSDVTLEDTRELIDTFVSGYRKIIDPYVLGSREEQTKIHQEMCDLSIKFLLKGSAKKGAFTVDKTWYRLWLPVQFKDQLEVEVMIEATRKHRDDPTFMSFLESVIEFRSLES